MPQGAEQATFRVGLDRVATLLLLLVLSAMAVGLLHVGVVVAFPADVCGSDGVTCDFSAVRAGAAVATWAPLGVLVVALVVSAVRVGRRRMAFAVPLAGMAGVVVVVLVALRIVDLAITGD